MASVRLPRNHQIPEDVTDDDEIMALIQRTIEDNRKHPITPDELHQGQEMLRALSGYGTAGVGAGPSAESEPVLLPFVARSVVQQKNVLELGRSLYTELSQLHRDAETKRSSLSRGQHALQVRLLSPRDNAPLYRSNFYGKVSRFLAPVFYMADNHKFQGAAGQVALARALAMPSQYGTSVAEQVTTLEVGTGYSLLAGCYVADLSTLFGIFTDDDTRHYACMVVFRFLPDATGALPNPVGGTLTMLREFIVGTPGQVASVTFASLRCYYWGHSFFSSLVYPYDDLVDSALASVSK